MPLEGSGLGGDRNCVRVTTVEEALVMRSAARGQGLAITHWTHAAAARDTWRGSSAARAPCCYLQVRTLARMIMLRAWGACV